MALWTEIKPAELTAFSREAYAALDVGILNTILPNLYQDQVKFTWRVNAVLDGTALFGEFDTEAPIGAEGGAEEKTMRLIPVMRKLRLSEYEQVTDLDRIRALAEDKADKVVRFVINRLAQARAEALANGTLAINENWVVQNLNFGRAANQTRVVPATLWSAAGSDPVADLRAWSDRVADASGVAPDLLVMSSRVATALGARLAGAGYITSDTGVVSRAAVAEVLASHELPAPTVFDGRVNGARLMADNLLVLAPSGGAAGSTVHAPTVESQDPRYGLRGNEPGIIAGVYSEDDPPVKWVLGKAVALPVLSNPNTTLSATPLA